MEAWSLKFAAGWNVAKKKVVKKKGVGKLRFSFSTGE
jgi:hypothetical protein